MNGKGREGQRWSVQSADASLNVGARRSPERMGDAQCGGRVGVAVLWCKIVLRVEVEVT